MEEFLAETARKVMLAINSTRDPVEQVTNLIRTISEQLKVLQPPALYDLQKHYPHIWDKVEQFRAKKIQEMFQGLFLQDTEERFRKINPKIFTVALIASIKATVNPAFIMENNLSPEETIRSLFTIFLQGIVKRPNELSSPHEG